MMVIGLTGIIGSGKSTVSRILSEEGYPVIDLDEIVNELIGKEEIVRAVKDLFGEDFVHDGKVLKKKLSEKVFSDETLLRKYEALVHPKVIEEMKGRLEELRSEGQRIVFVEAPLIFETGTRALFDKVVVVYAEEKEVIRRMEKRGFEKTDVIMRLKRQIPISEKEKMADFVIYNTSSLSELRLKVKELLEKIGEWEGE